MRILSLEVITTCNLACTNCFALAAIPEGSVLSFAEALRRMQLGREAGFDTLHLTGGEPMLWREFFPAVTAAHDLGYQEVYINTNGSYLHSSRLQQLLALHLKMSAAGKTGIRLTISLNGFATTHEAVRGRATYAPAAQAIDNALQAGIPVEVFTTVGVSLVPGLPEFLDFIRNRWALPYPEVFKAVVLIQMHRVAEDECDVISEMLSPDQFIAVVQTAALFNSIGLPVVFLDNPLSNVVADRSGFFSLMRSVSGRNSGHVFVLMDGRLTPVHSVRESAGILNSVHDLTAAARAFAGPDESAVVCKTCSHQEDCRSNGNLFPMRPAFSLSGQPPFCALVLERLSERLPWHRAHPG